MLVNLLTNHKEILFSNEQLVKEFIICTKYKKQLLL